MARDILERHEHPKYPRLHLLRRERSRFYYAHTFLDGRKVKRSLKTPHLPTALKLGEDWYRKLLRASINVGRKHPLDRLATDPTIAELFSSYRTTLMPSKRAYADMKWGPIQHFWRTLVVSEITPQSFREFYAWRRRRKTPKGTTITNHALHKDMMVVRQILKYALEEGHMDRLPIIPKVGKIAANPRPWFDRDEWDRLIDLAISRMVEAKGNKRLHRQREDLVDFMIFMIESCLRVGELRALTVGQVRVVPKAAKEPAHLILDVKGKRGHRVAVAGGLAVDTFERRSEGLKPYEPLWKHGQRDAFRELLIAAGLRTDAFGVERNLKSLRATAISFKILAQAPTPNLLLIARNAGTSVTQIDQFYAKRLTAEMGVSELAKSTVL